MTPSTSLPLATTSGVPPARATFWTVISTSCGKVPPCSFTHCATLSAAPLRMETAGWPSCPAMSTPLMRVEAENGTKATCSASMWLPRMPNSFLASTTMLRPSGVSSDREASWAASASFCSSTPGAGRNSFAIRLPKVMVPVLSSISTSMSPAASTARPDVASTFRRTRRSMPLMPMALSRPPIVVGIRHTSRETRTGREIWPSARKPSSRAESSMYPAMAGRENTTAMKTMVSAASRMPSAISLGVL